MSEDTNLINKPKKLWDNALKMVKGENTTQLVEQFTAEMTLVAEGLCEDQNKLRGEMDKLLRAEDQRIQGLDARIGESESALEEHLRENDRIITELRDRLAALEKQKDRAEREARNQKEKKKERNLIRDITILILVAAAAVIAVTLVIKLV